jgi:hypothetical protein
MLVRNFQYLDEFTFETLTSSCVYFFINWYFNGQIILSRYVHWHAYVYRYQVMYAYLNLDNIDPCAEVIQVLVLVLVSTTSTTAVFNF